MGIKKKFQKSQRKSPENEVSYANSPIKIKKWHFFDFNRICFKRKKNRKKSLKKNRKSKKSTKNSLKKNMTEPHSTTTVSETHNLELPLKNLLENLLSLIEKLLTSQDEIDLIESKLHDYESLSELMDIILDIWSIFSASVAQKLAEKVAQKPKDEDFDVFSNEEYRKLEEILQKHESQIRDHIAVEQQLRLCAETFQSKIDEIAKEKQEILEENERNSEKFIKEIERLKNELFEEGKEKKEMKRKIGEFEGKIEGFLKKKNEEKSFTNRNFESFEANSPFTKRKPENFGNLKDYLKIRNENKRKKSQKFEEILFPKAL